MSEYVTLIKEHEVEVAVYRLEIGGRGVEFTLTTDFEDDLCIDISEEEAVKALKELYDEEQLKELFGLN